MTQPLDRTCRIEHIGDLAIDQGEFWVENPFEMPQKGENLSAYERNRLYLNAGGLEFVNASFASACDIDSDSRSIVPFDYDNDGDEDLLVGNVGGGCLRLFQNNFPEQNSIRVRLKGTESNSKGIGSRLVFKLKGRSITRDLFPANGFMASGPAEVVVGLAKAETVDSVEIRWPTGKTQVVTALPSNNLITVTEGKDGFDAIPFAELPK